MTRLLYAAAWLVLAPLAVLRLLWRSRRQRGYRERIGERFGLYASDAPRVPRIWIHAVSVGETRAAAPLVAALRRRHPGHRIVLTHMTPTGRATGVELFGDGVDRAWLPYDVGFAARRFLAHFRPDAGVVMETELWPRLLDECARARVPVILANARLSGRSARRYARFPALTRWLLSNLPLIAAQTSADAQRFRALGAGAVEVVGNVKFDVEVPAAMVERGLALRSAWAGDRPVWVAGSTREGEEELLLEAFARLPAPRALLVIVPRHPQRFDEVDALARARGWVVGRRSGEAPRDGVTVDVLVGDSMGEMFAYYAAGDLAIMGGSLLPYGSQNLIEPAALGKPVIVGPSTFNFQQAADGAIEAGGALRVADAGEALQAAARISADAMLRERMGARARAFVGEHRGAVERLAEAIGARLARQPGFSPPAPD